MSCFLKIHLIQGINVFGRGGSSEFFSFDESMDILLPTASGMCFIIFVGCLDCTLVYIGLSIGFVHGLRVPVSRSRVASKKVFSFFFQINVQLSLTQKFGIF